MNSFKIFIFILLATYLLGGVILYFLQEQFIFLPESLDQDYKYSFEQSFDEHNLEMEDGAKINLLHFTLPESKGLIVYFHGNAGSLARWGEIAIPFVEMGHEVIIPDYRGYGKSTGKRSQKQMLKDAEAVYEFAKTKQPEGRITLFGRSLGSGFASYLTGKNNPKKLILETPFYSLREVAGSLIPIYPTGLLLKYQLPNFQYLKKVETPIYIFHGDKDEIVPLASGKRLYETLGENVKLITIKGGHHNDLSAFDSYWAEMEKVLNNE